MLNKLVQVGLKSLQRFTKRLVLGLVNFVSAVAYLFRLNLPAAFPQPRTSLLVKLCSSGIQWSPISLNGAIPLSGFDNICLQNKARAWATLCIAAVPGGYAPPASALPQVPATSQISSVSVLTRLAHPHIRHLVNALKTARLIA